MSKVAKVFLYIMAVIVGCIAVTIITIVQNPELIFQQTMDKPVIYLYPEKTTTYNIELDYVGELTFTYPTYKTGWNVVAQPSGVLTDVKTNKELNYLFWEGEYDFSYPMDEGFVVEKSEIIAFLEEKLKILGLNSRESEDFITFWGPRMTRHDYNVVRFLSMQEIKELAKLTISPKTDSDIRVYMIYKGLSEKIEIKEQFLKTPERTGDVMVEWGGTEYR